MYTKKSYNPFIENIMTESIADIKELLSQNALRQAWLDVESSLAQVQSELGIIPEEAAREISRKASLDFIDTEELSKDIIELILGRDFLMDEFHCENYLLKENKGDAFKKYVKNPIQIGKKEYKKILSLLF